MEDHDKSKDQLIQELHSLRQLVADFKDPLFVAQNAARQYDDPDRLVYEDLPLGYQSLDENGFFLEVNPAWLTTMGYSRQQVIGKWFGDFLAPGYQDHFKVNFPKFKAAGEIHGVEFEMVRRDGSVISVMFDGQIGRDSTGRFKQTHCILQDVTERRSAEVALRESEERFRILVETMHEGVGIRDKNGLVVYANDRLAEMVGYPKDQILGHDVTEFLDDANKQILHQYSDALRKGDYSPYELEVVRGDGQKMSMTVSGKPIYGRDGLLKGTFAVMMDITARKRAEEALRNSEQMLGSILATCPVGIGMAQDRVMKWVNDAWVKMFGFENEQEGMNLNARALYPSQEEFERVGKELYAGLEPGKVTGTDTKFRRKDGSVFEAHIRMQLVDTEGPEKVTIAAITDISDRKRHEEELNRSHNKLTSILESISDAFFVLDNDMVVTYFNEAAERLLGKPRQEVLGYKLFDAFSEARGSIFEEKYTMALREKVSVSFETYFEVPPYVNWYEVRVYPFEEGISVYFQVTTARKQTEKKLRDSESRFQAFMENAPMLAFMKDSRGLFVYGNRKWLSVHDFIGRDWQGKSAEQIFSQEVAPLFVETDKLVREQNRFVEFIVPFPNPDGSLSQWWTFKFPVQGAEGPGYVGGVAVDISERVRAEEALRESEDRHRRISAVMSDIAYSCTKLPCTAYSIDWITGATERVLGYSADELKTLKCWRSIVVQEDLPTFDMNVIGIPPNASRSCELRMRRKTGEEIWVSSLVECVMDLDSPDGLRLYGGLIDITERKKLEGQLLQAQKMEAIGTLAAGIAHDFNNMLQVIVGYTDLLLLEKKEGDPGYEELQKIIKTSYDARDLVQKIRLVSRKADIKQVPCELNHRVKEVSELLSQTLPRTINLHVHLTENLATIEADPALMNQMVMNLGINAGEAMSEGGTLTIKTENKALDNDFCRKHPGLEPGLHVLLTISDTGKGIAPEHLDRLFDPFYSTKVRDYHKGTGLGLPVVRGIVEMHKGFIDVESEVGRGTTFRVYLPLMKVVKAPEKEVEIQPPPRGTETILLVEDEELVRNLGVYALEQFGYKVLAVGDGQEALEVYEREKENISLVILDIIMPRMDGKQCFRELLRMNPNIRVLISSGIIQRELIHEVVNLGAKGSLVKPFDVRDLLLKVREVIDTD